MESIWRQSIQLFRRPALEGRLEAQAAVIGGGLAGILTAYFLEQRGIHTVVLEAGRIAGGATGKTTAKITSQHGLIYGKLIKQQGKERAAQYAQAQQRAVEDYRALIAAREIDCDFEERPAYLYSTQSDTPLREEAEAAGSLGLPAELVTATELPFPVKGALRFDGQAQFHPLKFLSAIASGLTIYEESPVRRVEGQEITTEHGTVRAEHIIFATHYPFVNAPGYYFLRMHQERSYVLALENAMELHGMYYGVDPGGLSLRGCGGLLLLGGGNHRTGENSAGGKYELLRQAAARLWPESREAAHWSAQDCIPLDGVPYIGRFSASTPNWYVATGFHKWGMTSSMAAARRLSTLIAGEEDESGEVFSPQRFDLPASAKQLLEDGVQAAKGLGRAVLSPPRAALEELPAGHGGVVEWEGEKVGVYRDGDGNCHVVPIRCPHLGCQLEWNPDELSWDCPCHGSRFDVDGNLLDTPAQTGLTQ